MIAALALALLVGAAPILPEPDRPPSAVAAVPAEADAVVLPGTETFQAIVADVDGDGERDLVRLEGRGDAGIVVEVWRHGDRGWAPAGEPVTVVPGPAASEPGQLVFAGAPARLIVRKVAGAERIMLVRQPRFEEPGLEVDCCLLVHDVIVGDEGVELVAVTDELQAADAVLALDMDGDGTDEMLVTRGLPPLGGITYPTDAHILRWAGERFATPVLTELLVGSGVSPFVLGDSDGQPGVEAAFIGAESRLHRLSLRDDDTLVAESAESGMLAAVAVPTDDGRGLATIRERIGIEVRPWPRDEPVGRPVAISPFEGDLLGIATSLDGGVALILRVSAATIRVPVPRLSPLTSPLFTPAATTVSGGPAKPFAGLLPGGGANGEPSLLVGGELVSEDGDNRRTATLPGLTPVGLVGPGDEWVALWHGLRDGPAGDQFGGRLDVPSAAPGSGVSLVPLAALGVAEQDGAVLEPPLTGALEAGEELLVTEEGFRATIEAPPGSRVYVQLGAENQVEVLVISAAGSLEVALPPPDAGGEMVSEYAPVLTVATPGGHGYLARWPATVLRNPTLEARSDTPIGSPTVMVHGETSPFVEVSVAGRPVSVDDAGRFTTTIELPPWPAEIEVVATDRLGNESRTTVVGVGWFDYRALPWTAIVIAAVAAAGGLLALRAPRIRKGEAAAAEEEGVLEEIDPED